MGKNDDLYSTGNGQEEDAGGREEKDVGCQATSSSYPDKLHIDKSDRHQQEEQ